MIHAGGDSQMGWVESIQQAIQYIEEHLLDDLTIEQVAKEANSSAFHFQRTFSVLTDMSIADYIRRRRLTLAAQDLLNTNEKIIDLSYKYGYETPEAFTKAFRKQHGVTPSEARKKVGKLEAYNRLVIQVTLKGAEPMKYQIVEKDSFQVVGLKRSYNCATEENLRGIPLFWNEVNQDGTSDSIISLNNGEVKGALGICAMGEDFEVDSMIDYWIGVNFVGKAPENLETLEIPASKWAIFEVHGPMPDAMQKTWKKIYSEWFPSNSYKQAGTPEMEVYTDDDPSDPNCYSEIWIPIK